MTSILTTPLVLLLLSGPPPTAGETLVPTSVQGAIIGKVLPYVRGFQGAEVRILVVHTEAEKGLADEAVLALEGPGVASAPVELSALNGKIAFANAVYVLPGVDSAAVKSLCRQSGVLSISAVPSLVESGDFSIGIGTRKGRPQILVNLSGLEAEGHQVSSELLKLARVIE